MIQIYVFLRFCIIGFPKTTWSMQSIIVLSQRRDLPGSQLTMRERERPSLHLGKISHRGESQWSWASTHDRTFRSLTRRSNGCWYIGSHGCFIVWAMQGMKGRQKRINTWPLKAPKCGWPVCVCMGKGLSHNAMGWLLCQYGSISTGELFSFFGT